MLLRRLVLDLLDLLAFLLDELTFLDVIFNLCLEFAFVPEMVPERMI